MSALTLTFILNFTTMKTYFLIDDEVTGKALNILAESLEEAEVLSTFVDYTKYEDGVRIDPMEI